MSGGSGFASVFVAPASFKTGQQQVRRQQTPASGTAEGAREHARNRKAINFLDLVID